MPLVLPDADTPGDRRGMAGIGQVLIDEIERDVRRIGRQRQRVIGLLGHRCARRQADHRPVVGTGDCDLYRSRDVAAMVVENLDVIGEDQSLVLGEKIEIIIYIAERPFDFPEPLLSLTIGGCHGRIEVREHRRRNYRASRHHSRLQRRGGRVRIVAIGVGKIHGAGQQVRRQQIRSVGSLGKASGCVRRCESRCMIGHEKTPAYVPNGPRRAKATGAKK